MNNENTYSKSKCLPSIPMRAPGTKDVFILRRLTSVPCAQPTEPGSLTFAKAPPNSWQVRLATVPNAKLTPDIHLYVCVCVCMSIKKVVIHTYMQIIN